MNTLNFTLSFEMKGCNEVFKRQITVQEKDVTNHPGGKFNQDKVRTAIRAALKRDFPNGCANIQNLYAKIGNYKVYIGGINE